MTEPSFLDCDVAPFLHDQALREYGGIQGVGLEHLLHSALDRPVNKLARADADGLDLFDLAAGYAYGRASNHPFDDGDKRTAWSSCVLFLKANGIEIDVLVPDAVEQVVRPAIVTGRTADDVVRSGDASVWWPAARAPAPEAIP